MKKFVLIALLYLSAPTLDIANAQTNSLKTLETELHQVSKNRSSDFVISADGKRLAYTIGEGVYDPEMGLSEGWPKHRLVVDGKAGKAYPRIFDIQFSADSQRVGYLTDAFAVVDSKEDQTFGPTAKLADNQQIRELHSFQFSPDSKSYAYATASANADGPSSIVLNGKKQKPYAQVHGPLFSPDGRRLAYSARTSNPWKELLVLDGQKLPAVGHLIQDGNLKFSPDSSQLSFQTHDTETKKSKLFLIKDGKQIAAWLGGDQARVFSPDSKHFAYAVQTGQQEQAMQIDGTAGKPYQAWRLYQTVFSPDSRRFAFVVTSFNPAERKGKNFVVVDGKNGKPYHEISLQDPVFSADSKHIAYAAYDGLSWFAVLDGVEGPHLKGVKDLQFNPANGQLAYIVTKADKLGDKQCVNYRGENGKLYDQVTDITFSSDGSLMAYAARNNKDKSWRIVVNGKEGPSFDFILVKGAIDEKTFKPLDQGSLRFDHDNRLHFLAVRRGRLYMVETMVP